MIVHEECGFEFAAAITAWYIISKSGEVAKSISKLKYPAIVLGSQTFVLLPTDLLKEKTKSKTFDILSTFPER